jgi:hypothetical protein
MNVNLFPLHLQLLLKLQSLRPGEASIEGGVMHPDPWSDKYHGRKGHAVTKAQESYRIFP